MSSPHGYNQALEPLLPIALFSAALLFLFYVLLGYPVLLWVAAKNEHPVRREPFEPSVSFIIAVHNGERYLARKLQSIAELDYPPHRIQIIVASDGSTDATAKIAREFAMHHVQVLALPRGGKSKALTAAMQQATGEILVFSDVRQLLAPDSLRRLMENFADPKVGVASAELVIRSGNREQANVGLYWKYEFWLRLQLSRIDSIFGATGAYYGMRRSLSVPIPPHILLDDMYLPLAAFFQGYRLIVDPRARMFDEPTNLQTEFRRKVRTLAGNYQILAAYPHLLTFRNRMLLHFLSYKFARLLLPFALLTIFVASFSFPRPWNLLLLASQSLFYGAALGDHWIPDRWPLKKLTSPIRTFSTLMAATLLAPVALWVPQEKLWRPTTASRG